jgi:hypothetical protein
MAADLRSFPSDDAVFRAAIADALRGIDVAGDRELLAAAAERLEPLRARWPRLRWTVPTSLGRADGELVLYVFRDGRAGGSGEGS